MAGRRSTLKDIVVPHFQLGAEYTEAVAGATEAPTSFHYACLLTAVGALVGRRVWLPYSQKLYANLFTCIVGASGLTRKTTSIRLCLAMFEERLNVLRGLSSFEGLMLQLRTTPDILVVLEEFSSFLLKVKKQESISSALPKLAELYDNPTRVTLPTRVDPIEVINPFVSVLTATTPEWLANSLQLADIMGGIGNRFMFIFGEVSNPVTLPRVPSYGDLPERILKRVERFKGESKLAIDPHGEEVWKMAYKTWYEQQKGQDEIRRVLDIRMPVLSLKIAMLLHVLEGRGACIKRQHIEAAIEYVNGVRGYLDELRPLFSPLEDKILHLIRREGEVKRWRLHEVIGGKVRGKDFHEAVQVLLRYKRIVEDTNGVIRLAKEN